MQEQLVDLGRRRGHLRLNTVFAGPPGGSLVVLLHGFPEHWWSWRNQIDVLATNGFRVVAIDLRGAGKSDIRGPYELQELAADVAALIEWERAHREAGGAPSASETIVIGHDWGGATAWTLARSRPELISRLVIVNACLPERQIDSLSLRLDLRQLSRSIYIFGIQLPWLPDFALSRNGGALVKTIIRQGMKDSTGISDAELAPFCTAATRPGGASGMLAPYRAVFRRALMDLLRSGDPFPDRSRTIDCKTLLIWGEADPAQGIELISDMDHVVGDLRIIRLPRCGHFPHSEDPRQVNDALLAFLKAD